MKHHLSRLNALLLALALTLSLAVPVRAAPGPDTDPPENFKVSLDYPTLELPVDGKEVTVTATASEITGYAFSSYSWAYADGASHTELTIVEAADKSYLTIGALSPTTSPITIRVTATWTDDNDSNSTKTAEATCAVTVKEDDPPPPVVVPVTGVTLDPSSITLDAGETATLTATVAPAANKGVAWESSDDTIATVKDGVVTAVKPGNATITVTTDDGDFTGKCSVTVQQPAYSITFQEGTYVHEGDNGKLAVQFNVNDNSATAFVDVTAPDNDYQVEWSIEAGGEQLITKADGSTSVDLFPMRPHVAGQTTVTAALYTKAGELIKTQSGTPVQAELTVIVSGITLNRSTLTMMEGAAAVLSVSGTYGEALKASPTIRWTSSDPSVVSVDNGSLTAWSKSSRPITITAKRGSYEAYCVITVVEDEGTLVDLGSVTAGNSVALTANGAAGQLNTIAQNRTVNKTDMDYVTGLYVSPSQGIVHNTYRSEDDTGAGIGMGEQYTVRGSGANSLAALAFVPNRNFSGEARISYTGYADGMLITGSFVVDVSPMSDVTYSGMAGSPISFQARDFETICMTRTNHSLQYVTFSLPSASAGALYYNYSSTEHPGQTVTPSTRFRQIGSPNLGDVAFVPSLGYSGTVRITYRAVDTANTSYSGTVIISVTGQGAGTAQADIRLDGEKGAQITLSASDFSAACWDFLGETLSHVRFTPPAHSDGTLFYNYRSFSDYDKMVSSGDNYYRVSTPSLNGVSFLPTTTTPSRVTIPYTGYGLSGKAFSGNVYIDFDQLAETGVRYSVYSGETVTFLSSDFNSACQAATTSDLSYVIFDNLPYDHQGTVYLNYFSNGREPAYVGGTYYRTGSVSQTLIGQLTFLAGNDFSGLLRLPFTGYSVSGNIFHSEVVLQVEPSATGTVSYTATNTSPIPLSVTRIQAACRELLKGDVAYITFPSLPDPDSGKLILNYGGIGSGTPATVNARYYLSGSPSVANLSFIPRGRFTGTLTLPYVAWSSAGERTDGSIVFHIIDPAGSVYFSDLGGCLWGASAVDFLYENKVTVGVTDTTYAPLQQILRRDFVVMLDRALGFGNYGTYSYSDVPTDQYYSQAIAAAKRLGVLSGGDYGTRFDPDTPITRQDAMLFIRNAMSAMGKDLGTASTGVLARFSDAWEVDSYAKEAVSTLVQMGAVLGDGNGRLNPKATITRAEAAVILHFVLTL